MKELTKEQKLEVLKECIREYKVLPIYLCPLIACTARSIYMINDNEYFNHSNSTIAKTLIPELLKFKPEDKELNMGWFGGRETGYEKRKEVLDELYELIKNSHE
jgi:hypothetical protein